jgi:L-threonylcarbamoyladenylate synthase
MGRIWEWREEEAGACWAEARRVLGAGGLLAVPTETYYALAVNPFDEDALKRLFALKERAAEKPVLVLVSDTEMLAQVAREVPEAARALMARFWPGPLTIILPAREGLPALLTGNTGTVGVRQPAQPVTLGLLKALGFPLTGTSANRAGHAPLTEAAAVERDLGEGVDLILAAGTCPGGQPSTIVDASGYPVRLVRAGAIPAQAVAAIMPEMTR